MNIAHVVLLYQLVTLLAGFGAWIAILVLHSLHPSPLGRRFLQFSAPFAVFYFLIGIAAYVLGSPDFDPLTMEFWGDTVFCLLYAAMVPPWTAFQRELVQKPFRGPWQQAALGLSAVGTLAAALLLFWPAAPGEKTEVARFFLQVVYLPAMLAWLAVLAVEVWTKAPKSDPWKRTTGRGLVILLAVGFPLFVADALWPWFQMGGGWVPRGFNFHGVFYVAFHLFMAHRWLVRTRELEKPASLVHNADPERVRTLGLTSREEEVLGLVFAGLSNQDIADRLDLSLGTVKNHVYKIYQKSGASSRKEILEMLKA